jgi:hypothetical protein
MMTLDQEIKQTASLCKLTPRAALLFHRVFLDQATMEERKELVEWTQESEVHGYLLDLIFKQ